MLNKKNTNLQLKYLLKNLYENKHYCKAEHV